MEVQHFSSLFGSRSHIVPIWFYYRCLHVFGGAFSPRSFWKVRGLHPKPWKGTFNKNTAPLSNEHKVDGSEIRLTSWGWWFVICPVIYKSRFYTSQVCPINSMPGDFFLPFHLFWMEVDSCANVQHFRRHGVKCQQGTWRTGFNNLKLIMSYAKQKHVYKWSHNPCNWPCKWVTGVITCYNPFKLSYGPLREKLVGAQLVLVYSIVTYQHPSGR